jgi:predicted RecB family nuclease
MTARTTAKDIMQRYGEHILHSASDVVNFLECEHICYLDRIDLVTPLPRAADDDTARLVQEKGYAHEAAYASQLAGASASFIDIAEGRRSLDEKTAATREAMRSGVEVIFQAAFRDGPFVGHADFLRKVERPSALGPFSYEVVDTKLARSVKTKFLVQLAFYSWMVGKAQGLAPQLMHVVLGHKEERSFRYADYSRYFLTVRDEYLSRATGDASPPYPHVCEKCSQCKWRERCDERRLADDHLSQVANISRLHIKKLEEAGITTLAALAQADQDERIAKLAPDTFAKLRHQAALQFKARQTGMRHLDLLPTDPGVVRGFARLPAPDPGDMFFDMEGDPLEEGGLEYLFGLYFFDAGHAVFKPFWAHTRAEEKTVFEQFMDFVTARLRQYPGAYIYHYAAYEVTALKKLMSLHGTREADVDNLLRRAKLVDLYKVVREGMRVSEPRYSIKNIERFYMKAREGDVQNAGASIVFYEQWKVNQNPKLLKDIEDYNFDDVRSTYELREWLMTLRPAATPWFGAAHGGEAAPARSENAALSDAEKALVPYREKLADVLPPDRTMWNAEHRLKELTFQLLDFHRRAEKPAWWAMFNRMDMSPDELLDDAESIARLVADPDHPPAAVNRSIRYTFLFPEQETKLKTGDGCVLAHNGVTVSDLVVDHNARRVSFKVGPKKESPPPVLDIGMGGPISSDKLKDAVFRFADSIVGASGAYPALCAFLNREAPRITGHAPGSAIVDDAQEALPQIIDAIARLDRGAVFLQGPPGAGKTYTGSHVIVELLRRGCSVGISSNSHKAINNLLAGVEKVAAAQKLEFYGVKKSPMDNDDARFDGRQIVDVARNDEVAMALDSGARLVAGTAWLFADPNLDQALDYLFVDEAGQVALANLVAMGVSARNIVLLGDQMQLGQPIQGVHPGRSGESSLEYFLDGVSTIAPERGIFLKTSYRMHPDVCRFISDAIYDGRLEAECDNHRQTLVLCPDAHPALRPTGIVYLPIKHDACSQKSLEEAELTRLLYADLLRQSYTDRHGQTHAMAAENILVIAPYNMQVNLLRQVLPGGARIGTVDKFQGQEAEVVIVSMATSSGDYLPRFIEFLYSRNRTNVAISRAKCLALFIANPALMSIRCSTPVEMALVNTLCWIKDYSDGCMENME